MKIIKKIQQCIKHIKTMFYTKMLAVSLKKMRIFVDKIRIKFYIKKQQKYIDMIENNRPLGFKRENIYLSRKFIISFLNYIETDTDCKEFYVSGGEHYNPIKNTYSLGCRFNTGDDFSLEYIGTQQLDNGENLIFQFKKLVHYYKEDGFLLDGTVIYKEISEQQPTGLIFYIKYFGDMFTTMTTDIKSTKTNDFEFIINKIVDELIKPNR
jgi:hypothetical protein